MATHAPSATRTIDFGRALTFVGEDPDWIKKLLIGGAFTLACTVLVGLPFVLGYAWRTFRNVVAGSARPLPEWDELGGLFSEGLRLTLVYFAHVLGVLAVFFLLAAVLLAPIFMAAGSDGHVPDALGVVGALGMVALYAAIFVVGLALFVYLPAAIARAALAERAGAAFEVGANLAFIRDHLGNYALALVAYLIASFLSQFGFLLCCVGVFPAAFWSHLVLSHALGEAVRLGPGRR